MQKDNQNKTHALNIAAAAAVTPDSQYSINVGFKVFQYLKILNIHVNVRFKICKLKYKNRIGLNIVTSGELNYIDPVL